MIGARLRKLRGEISQEAFAKSAGIAVSALSRYEREVQKPGIDLLFYLLNQGFSVDWLITGTGSARLQSSELEAFVFGDIDYNKIAKSVAGVATHAGIDLNTLQEAIEAVREAGVATLPIKEESVLIARIYGLIKEKASFGAIMRCINAATVLQRDTAEVAKTT